jgi:predicted amidohydrolase YtcJ
MRNERVLYRRGRLTSRAVDELTSFVVEGDRFTWVGPSREEPHADRQVDLDGRLVTPGFVDAHVHATSSGLALTGLDLTQASDAAHLLDLVSDAARMQPTGVILGHGWDDSSWSKPQLPTRAELDTASGGLPTYLSRIDVHSALVTTALLDLAPNARACTGFDEFGPLSREAHHDVRDVALGSIDAGQRKAAQLAFLERAAALGIVAVHEMAGPTISSEDDLRALLHLAGQGATPMVAGYWGELAVEGGLERARDLGAIGVAGDLFIDGSLGSRTACLHQSYADAPGTRGAAYLSADQVCEHVVAATRHGMQAGFHVIGDAACSIVTEGFRRAAQDVGPTALRQARHRIEHAEMLSDDDIQTLQDLGIAASMQPLFDALWGGDSGMYSERLGASRARPMNRLRSLARSGVRLALGSDAPVTPLGPWDAIRAAVHHRTPSEAITFDVAFDAHTKGAWQTAGVDDAGDVSTGQVAHVAVWDFLTVQELMSHTAPLAAATMVSGVIIRDAGVVG